MSQSKIMRPVLVQMMEFSTAHITRIDNERLLHIDNSWLADIFVVEAKKGGFLIALCRQEITPDDVGRIKKRGLSNAFIRILKESGHYRCDWILIDQDVSPYPAMKKYNW